MSKIKIKTIEVIALIADGNADKDGDIYPHESIAGMEFPKEVPVTLDFRHGIENIVGRAKLYKTGKTIKASVKLFMDHPEMREEFLPFLTPCVGGKIIEREGNVIKKWRIDSIGLCPENADPRIGPLCPRKKKVKS